MGSEARVKEIVFGFKEFEHSISKSSDHVKSILDRTLKEGGMDFNMDKYNELFIQSNAKINISAMFTGLEKLSIVIKKVSFYKDIAVFRYNLMHTAKELDGYSKTYPDLVGKAIGDRISRLKNQYTELINQINDNKSGMGLEIDLFNSTAKDGLKISKEQLKALYTWQCEARVGLYKKVEAIDLYLYHGCCS